MIAAKGKIRRSDSTESIMPKPRKAIAGATYSERLAIRFRALREAAGLTVTDAAKAITKAGYRLSVSGCYSWENNRLDVQVDAAPAIAKAFKLASVREVFPEK